METVGERQLPESAIVRVHVTVRGIVQGVGFRPFVHRLARAHRLNGWVLNSTEGVEIEAEGNPSAVKAFLVDLSARAPQAARIDAVRAHYLPPVGYLTFTIEGSHNSNTGIALVSPDIATCPKCLAELFAVTDRRYHYPFINCTDCGPRFTIIESLPYDRPRTTMKRFVMCGSCQKEYDDPSDRRFHAQPNACQTCGPSIELRVLSQATGVSIARQLGNADEVIAEVVRLLRVGAIVAIKGLGGFHLACDARNAAALRRLRERKRRVEKPFALMAHDLQTVQQLCRVSENEARLLTSARRPIVLLDRLPEALLPDEVAPRNRRLGVMLPYTPLHHLLFAAGSEHGLDLLVMTSGNASEEPIAKDNDEALRRLASLADAFLLHNRPIHVRCDDSVTQVFEGNEFVIRRARGYTPLPVHFDSDLVPVLACGAQMKNTFCLARDSYAFLSQHIGDLDDQETLEFFQEMVGHFVNIFRSEPQVVAHDLHPDYLSTRYALSLSRPLVGVQHHHAHVVSCMAENGLRRRVIGVAFDGTGYGADGRVWGGEFLVADQSHFLRAAHLKYVRLPGAEAAIKRPYRMALSYLMAAYGGDLPRVNLVDDIAAAEIEAVAAQVSRGINSPLASSCGRLFDAVAALLGFRGQVTYEGQAAVELEMMAEEGVLDGYRFSYIGQSPLQIDPLPVIRAIVGDLRSGVEREVIAAKFHNGLADMIVDVCSMLRERFGLNAICLSGGVFQNRYLLRRALARLRARGFDVFIHRLVPCNDGGISLGQAVVASARWKEGWR